MSEHGTTSASLLNRQEAEGRRSTPSNPSARGPLWPYRPASLRPESRHSSEVRQRQFGVATEAEPFIRNLNFRSRYMASTLRLSGSC